MGGSSRFWFGCAHPVLAVDMTSAWDEGGGAMDYEPLEVEAWEMMRKCISSVQTPRILVPIISL